jgi:uncharacterized ion transporter superfamily protein YfcC
MLDPEQMPEWLQQEIAQHRAAETRDRLHIGAIACIVFIAFVGGALAILSHAGMI